MKHIFQDKYTIKVRDDFNSFNSDNKEKEEIIPFELMTGFQLDSQSTFEWILMVHLSIDLLVFQSIYIMSI